MSKGRARQFDLDRALDRAEAAFRADGFAGAAVTGLMGAMGIGAGSFYAAFGSKQALYAMVLDRHVRAALTAARDRREPRLALTGLLQAGAARLYASEGRPGCLFVLSGAHQHPAAARRWRQFRSALRREIEAAAGARNARDLAIAFEAILDAMAVQAMAGQALPDLMRTALHGLDMALARLPGAKAGVAA